MSKLILESYFVVVTCAECGMMFAVPQIYKEKRKEDHKTFNCPNGHGNYFPQMSDEEKLREQLDHCQTNRDYWKDNYDSVTRSRSALKGVITKMKESHNN